MTATEELRRMLDERGVEWHGDIATYWCDADAVESLFADNALDVSLYAISPEQAIEATLGRGTCKDIDETRKFSDKTRFECSECGYEYSAVGGFGCDYGDEPDFNYCPNCGRRVVAGDEA